MTSKKEKEKNLPLATEIIRSLKKIIYFLIVLEIFTILGFMWYLSSPIEDSTTSNITQEATDIEDSDIVQTMEGE